MNIKTAERLIQLRKEHGFSQEELAAKLGVSRQAGSKWERGEASPDTDNLIALAKLYQISLDELLDHKVEPKEEKEEEKIEVDTSIDEKEKKKKDKVHIGWNGIHVESEDGDEVHVDIHGVHVNDHEGTKVDVSKNGVFVDGKKKHVFGSKKKKIIGLLNGIYSFLMMFGFIFVGCMWNVWHPTWLCFLTIPIFSSLLEAIDKKRFNHFAYPILVVFIYLLFGFLNNMGVIYIKGNWWHPYWFLFLTIPLYYMIGDFFKKLFEKNE